MPDSERNAEPYRSCPWLRAAMIGSPHLKTMPPKLVGSMTACRKDCAKLDGYNNRCQREAR
jgi:hypothetical protein